MADTPTTLFLAGILPASKARALKALPQVRPEMLSGDNERFLYTGICSYIDKYGDLPTQQVMRQVVSAQADAGTASAIWQTYAIACSTAVNDAEFEYAVDELLDAATKRATGEALAVAFEILDSGYQIGSEVVQGHEAAREYLSTKVAEISRAGLSEALVEVDMAADTVSVWQEYHKRKNMPEGAGVKFGIKPLDEHTGGMQRGELVLAAGFTSSGKSMLCVQAAWSAAIEQGKNVYFGTSETSREDITHRLIARHSRLPKFGHPEGLDHSKIRRATLNATEEKILSAVLEDLYYSADYGKLHIAQIPRGATLNYFESRMLLKQHEWGIDLAVNDYLNLLKPEKSRGTQREEASDILKDAKVLATSFGGLGVALLSPWQINRAGHQAAQASQTYSLDSMSEASEAEKSADIVLTLLHNASMDTKRTAMQLLKNRNGALMAKTELAVDYRNSYFAALSGSGGASSGSVLSGGGFGR